MPVAYLLDFDGTISPTDIGAAFMRRFSKRADALGALVERWRAGEIGSREVTETECGWLVVGEDEALDFARGFALDPEFATFVREATARGEAVEVVSDGLDFYVRDHLARAGFASLPWSANGSVFADGGVRPTFAPPRGCGQCGNCKGAHVERYRARGFEVVLVGDGLSDRCGARHAHHVIARGDLLAWCRELGIPAAPFTGFGDVIAAARARARGNGHASKPGRLGVARGLRAAVAARSAGRSRGSNRPTTVHGS